MRALLPETATSDDLIAAYPWPAGHWVRGCVVTSIDGAQAGPDGLSGSISSPVDREVLAATRAMSDAYLVGARTVRVERYRRVLARPELANRRAALGKLSAPILAIVSGTCRFDWGRSDFQHSELPPMILTSAHADESDRRAARAAGCEVVVLPGERLSAESVLALLWERGLPHLTVEGGADLMAQVSAAGLLDEVDLTIAPILAGGPGRAPSLSILHRMDLVQLLEDRGFLFARYLRTGAL